MSVEHKIETEMTSARTVIDAYNENKARVEQQISQLEEQLEAGKEDVLIAEHMLKLLKRLRTTSEPEPTISAEKETTQSGEPVNSPESNKVADNHEGGPAELGHVQQLVYGVLPVGKKQALSVAEVKDRLNDAGYPARRDNNVARVLGALEEKRMVARFKKGRAYYWHKAT